ncbi:ATP synthase subunit G atp20 [Parahypoxylon ruwenzoriense]
MSSTLTRPMLRQSGAWGRIAARRFESTTTAKATEAVKESAAKASKAAAEYSAKASEYSAKAAQGLSRVASSAGPAIAGAAKGVANSLSKFGGRTGRLVTFVEKQIPTVVFYSKVGSELAKIVFKGQNMAPPPLSTFQAYFQSAWKSLQNPGLRNSLVQTASKATEQPTTLIQRVRNLSPAQLATAGVLAAECLGFFTVGEMIGRFKIIGYYGSSGAAHH